MKNTNASPTERLKAFQQAVELYLGDRVSADYLKKRHAAEVDYGFAAFSRRRAKRFLIEHSTRIGVRWLIRLLGKTKAGRKNALALQLNTLEHRIKQLPKNLDGLRMLHISDTHIDHLPEAAENIAALLKGLDYDLCVHTGDFRERALPDWERSLELTKIFMQHLQAPVYACMGNHDLLCMVEPLEKMGARFLLNEHVSIPIRGETLCIAGVDDSFYYKTHDLKTATKGMPKDAFKILLAHEASVYKDAGSFGFSFMMSGHTHGGQICLKPNKPIARNAHCPDEMLCGAWTLEKLRGYTSFGVGCSGPPARFNCPPEITMHVLRSNE